ncbi:MAG TPA: tubulin-like doman-containing protein [Pirellulales bacterium]|nr:tubulin-like doman-containing protein [Pirellulales bacterium]
MSEAQFDQHYVKPPAADTSDIRPTVFIGLGGMASGVLRQLRKRFGESSLVGDLRFLALDTDSGDLRAAETAPAAERLLPVETLHLPLRKPAEYRSSSDEILRWLGRRWLYNIPRSLHTEGLRPLGRLAFVDHRLAIAERLHRAIGDGAPRVFVIASIDGGAGGGMLLDVAYAIRQAPTDSVCGLMLHATLARSPANDLRKANAYATLTELNHFMRGGAAFHTGPVEVLPAGDVSSPPFDDAYLIDLGQELCDAELDHGIRQIAEYLFLSATSCAAVLDGFRQSTRQQPAAGHPAVRLRSFGLHAIRVDKQAIAAAEADRLCLRLAQTWLGESEDGSAPPLRIQPPDFGLDDLAKRVQAIANKALGGSAETHFRGLVITETTRSTLSRDDDPAGRFGEELRRIHGVLGLPAVLEASQPSQLTRLETALRDSGQKLATALANTLVDSIAALVDQSPGRVPAALAGANVYQGHLRDLRQTAEEVLKRDQAEATALWSKLHRGELPRQRSWFGRLGAAGIDPETCLLDYCRLRLNVLVFQQLVSIVQEVSAQVASLNNRLIKLRQALQRLTSEFTATDAARPENASRDGSASLVAELDRFAGAEFLAELDGSLGQTVLAAEGGLLGLADASPDRWRALARQMNEFAREAVLSSLSGVDAASLLLKQGPGGPQLAAAMAKANARLLPDDGESHLFAVLPHGAAGEKIATEVRERSPNASVIVSSDSDLVFVREEDRIVLSDAAAALVEGRGDCAAAARRVLTRIDVSWTALDSPPGMLLTGA